MDSGKAKTQITKIGTHLKSLCYKIPTNTLALITAIKSLVFFIEIVNLLDRQLQMLRKLRPPMKKFAWKLSLKKHVWI